METKVHYVIVGVFVVFLGVALVAAAFWISGGGRKEGYNTYLVYMDEAVSGLSEKAPVKFNGVEVGYVQKINLNPENLKQVVLTVKIKQSIPITVSTTATLMSQGITGINYVGLKSKEAKAPLLKAKPGQPYPVIPSTPSLLVQLDTALREVTTNITGLTKSVGSIFNEKSRRAFEQSLTNIEKVTQVLANNSKRIDASIKSTQNLLHNVSQASNQLPTLIKDIKITAAEAKQTLTASRAAVQNFSDQTLPGAVHVLNQLGSVTSNLQQITTEIKDNPSVILRGKTPLPPGPGERQ